jgi:hypothetical protein
MTNPGILTDEWLPTPLATKALGYSAKTLKRYRDINKGFLKAGEHWNFGPSGAAAICWNITQCRKEFHHRGLMRFESAAISQKPVTMTNPNLLLGAIASTKAEIKRHEDALQVLMDDLALMYATGETGRPERRRWQSGQRFRQGVPLHSHELALQQCREGAATA